MLKVSNVGFFIVARKTNASIYWWEGVGPLHTSLIDMFMVMHFFATHNTIFYKIPTLSCQINIVCGIIFPNHMPPTNQDLYQVKSVLIYVFDLIDVLNVENNSSTLR